MIRVLHSGLLSKKPPVIAQHNICQSIWWHCLTISFFVIFISLEMPPRNLVCGHTTLVSSSLWGQPVFVAIYLMNHSFVHLFICDAIDVGKTKQTSEVSWPLAIIDVLIRRWGYEKEGDFCWHSSKGLVWGAGMRWKRALLRASLTEGVEPL